MLAATRAGVRSRWSLVRAVDEAGAVSDRSPCVRCGMMLHTGEGKVLVAFSVDELEELAYASPNARVAHRLACALGLLDEEREQAVLLARAEADRA